MPAMELAYLFGSLSHTPRRSLLGELIPRIDRMLKMLDETTPENYGTGVEYWDGMSTSPCIAAMVRSFAVGSTSLHQLTVQITAWAISFEVSAFSLLDIK